MSEDNQDNNDLIPEDDQGLISDFLTFLKEEKIWWVLPLILILIIFVVIIV